MGLWHRIRRAIGLRALYRELIGILGREQAEKLALAWHNQSGPVSLNVPGIPVPITVGPNDGFLVVELFGWRVYDFDLELPVKWILDAGANIGLASVFFACKYPQAQILAVEPDPENCELFRRNTASFPNVRLFQSGVWHRPCRVVCRNPTAEKFSLQFEEVERDAAHGVEAFPISHFLDEAGAARLDILKMDIEGAERAVFAADCANWLRNTRLVFVETHSREDQRVVCPRLEQTGFTRRAQHHWRWMPGPETVYTYQASGPAAAAG